ncbi:uncharacterized protein [Symphalangus syndactylus]|uniref:uncharacterized protein n=1 Tax=Symphalangus syndactylus TaxID=9590 RepID=UPI003003AD29
MIYPTFNRRRWPMPEQVSEPLNLRPRLIYVLFYVQVQPTLWCNANLWLDCITANKSIWRKRHLVKGHNAMECNAAMCDAAHKKTLSKYCMGQTYDPTFSRNRAMYWIASESPFSVSTLLFDAMPPHKSIRATVIFFFLLSPLAVMTQISIFIL